MAICSLILATKFYCETEDVVVNSNIERLLFPAGSETLNQMESTFADLIDFDLFVSLKDYNAEANKVNLLKR